ncbi:cache domain-containing protein [Niveispirillum sp. KHB5.9]|uniref:cache domain-containing protein n=1 Tax=Niveispirillum sp. KHB5.9 TaxID=3400269 RepID=UPI003A8B6A22
MRAHHLIAFLTVAAMQAGLPAHADPDRANRDEAIAMVKRAVVHLNEAGRDKAFADFGNREGAFVDRDLYVVVYDLTGRCLAHGANAKLIGKDLSDAEDIDGKLYIRERMELAKTNKSFWQDYKFTNPVNKKVEPKQMYCQVEQDLAVCGGVYK